MRNDGQQRVLARCASLLIIAFSLHNLEEAVTFDRFRGPSSALLSKLAGFQITVPPTWVFLAALAAVTIIGLIVVIWASRSPPTRAKRIVIGGFAIILLLNIALPHVPAAYLLGGYAPGVASAVLVNAPVAIAVLRQLHRIGQS